MSTDTVTIPKFNPLQRQGLPSSAIERVLDNIRLLQWQVNKLSEELEATYTDAKILTINPIDLAYEQKETKRSIKRLTVKREALEKALAQDLERRWTPKGTFSHLLSTGVFLG